MTRFFKFLPLRRDVITATMVVFFKSACLHQIMSVVRACFRRSLSLVDVPWYDCFCCCWYAIVAGVMIIGLDVYMFVLGPIRERNRCLCTNIAFYRYSWMTGSRSSLLVVANDLPINNFHAPITAKRVVLFAIYMIPWVYGIPMSSFLMSYTELRRTVQVWFTFNTGASFRNNYSSRFTIIDLRAVIFKEKCLTRNHMKSADEKSNHH